MSVPKNSIDTKTNLDTTPSEEQVTCALLTAVGRSAVAVIGVRGTNVTSQILHCFVPATSHRIRSGQIRYGTWGKTSESMPTSDGESIVIVAISDQELEIHSHGGTAAPTRIINDLRGLGAIEVDSGSYSATNRRPLLVHEAEAALLGCLTTRMAGYAMDQVRGAMLDWCQNSMAKLDEVSTESTLSQIKNEAMSICERSDLGLRMTSRFQVVLLGPPNVGKSSLINAIVGYDRSITMDMAGTTRDVLHAETVIEGIPIRLSDTAGIRSTSENIEQQGVAKAKNVANEADLVVLVRDPTSESIAAPEGKLVLRVLNKADLAFQMPTDELCTVAPTGDGIPELMQQIAEALVQFPPAGSPLPVSKRQLDLLQLISQAKSVQQLRIGLESLMA